MTGDIIIRSVGRLGQAFRALLRAAHLRPPKVVDRENATRDGRRARPVGDSRNPHVNPHLRRIGNAAHSATDPSELYPLPPEPLRWRVVGNNNPDAFLESSKRSLSFFSDLLARHGGSFKHSRAILDFGCGCGRLIRGLPPITAARLVGCDIDAEAIAWCQEYIPDAEFYATGEWPRLPFSDQSFDLIYAASVFTHIDAEHQFAWLAELKRVSRPGAFLILSYRHQWNIAQIADAAIKAEVERQMASSGMAFVTTSFWAGIFPAWYGGAYHSPAYVAENWGRYFKLLETVEPGDDPAKKPTIPGVTQTVTIARNV
jgi:SAM-dependent methyltransferase